MAPGPWKLDCNGYGNTVATYARIPGWTHHVLTYGQNNLSWYVGGAKVFSGTLGIDPLPPSSRIVELNWPGPDSDFSGAYADIGVWNRALSAAEVGGFFQVLTRLQNLENRPIETLISTFTNTVGPAVYAESSEGLGGKFVSQNGIALKAAQTGATLPTTSPALKVWRESANANYSGPMVDIVGTNGIQMQAPDGGKWIIIVNNDGTITTIAAP